jgi:hypothetical protein
MRLTALIVLATVAVTAAFSVPARTVAFGVASRAPTPTPRRTFTVLNERITDKRRKQLGITGDEDEYDLGVALENSTDPLISKIIAGALIVTIFALLVAGVIIPSLTDYGEGVCNPILTAGRC